ncbi:MAG: DUF2283 domain-containing protein [Caldilineaceae bacterium]
MQIKPLRLETIDIAKLWVHYDNEADSMVIYLTGAPVFAVSVLMEDDTYLKVDPLQRGILSAFMWKRGNGVSAHPSRIASTLAKITASGRNNAGLDDVLADAGLVDHLSVEGRPVPPPSSCNLRHNRLGKPLCLMICYPHVNPGSTAPSPQFAAPAHPIRTGATAGYPCPWAGNVARAFNCEAATGRQFETLVPGEVIENDNGTCYVVTERYPLHVQRGAQPLAHLLDHHPATFAAFHPAFGLQENIDFRQAVFLDTETTGLGGGAGVYCFYGGRRHL